MATVPSSATRIRFLSGIPFASDYKHSRWFDTLSAQTTYFLNKPLVHSMDEASFQRIEGRAYILADASIDELWGTNYVMFQNSNTNGKWFYGFVTKLEYKQTKTTLVHFEIDILQTWKFEMNFQPSFVIREHCKLWNEDGSPVVNTVDESLDYGSEYVTKSVETYRPYETVFFLVIVTKSAIHGTLENKITPIINGLPQPLSYYIHPFKLDGSIVKAEIGGADAELSNILEVIKSSAEKDNLANNVVSMYITDYIGTNATWDSATNTMSFSGVGFKKAVIAQDDTLTLHTIYVDRMVTYNNQLKVFPDKYSGYETVTESKLLMHPYTVLILDDLKGNRTTLKNEYIYSDDIVITIRGSLGTSNKTVYSVLDYNMDRLLDVGEQFSGSLEYSVINNNPSDIPVVTDMLSAYLQGNRNSLENQKASIMFNGAMGAVNNGVGAVASVGSGNVAGIASATGQVVQGAGNTVLQLQGLEAKKHDIGNTPPQLVKMGGNTNFDYGNDIAGLYIIKKQITSEYRKKLTNFFNLYGYKLNEVKIPNFHTRKYWNYVQTASCTITGNFNNEDLNELKAVFDNGITLWHTDDVGNYSLGNEVL